MTTSTTPADETTTGTGRRRIPAVAAKALGVACAAAALALGTAGPAAAAGPDIYDWDGDGVVDASAIDSNGDGWLDQNVLSVPNPDGGSKLMWLMDTNQDRVLDQLAADRDRNGHADAWLVDADQDRRFEHSAVDSDGNGHPEELHLNMMPFSPDGGGYSLTIGPMQWHPEDAFPGGAGYSGCYALIWTLPDGATCSIG